MSIPSPSPLPPLLGLPEPAQLPEEPASLVPPQEILLESRGDLRRRVLRRLWAPGLVLLGLWYVLLVLYVLGASPGFWLLSGLMALAEPTILRGTMIDLGFSGSGLATAFTMLPAGAAALSLAPALLVPKALAGMRPRRFLTEAGFQRAVADRAAALVMAVPVIVVLALPASVVLSLRQPWSGIGFGPLSAWCTGLLALLLAWSLVHRILSAPRLLGVTPADALQRTALIGSDPQERASAAAQVRGQDRRHLPPTPGSPQEHGARTLRGAVAALGAIVRSGLVWVLPAAAGAGAVVFGIADLVAVVVGMSTRDLSQVTSPLRSGQLLVAAVIGLLVLLGTALAPAIAVRAAEGAREAVRDQRTVPDWPTRARMNPWEARAVGTTGWVVAAITATGWALLAVVLQVLSLATAVSWTWVVIGVLLLAPLAGGAAAHAMRDGLRDVLYGPAGRFMRRESPHALVAPDIGTRADRARDPVVRAALRKRLSASGGDHSLELFDLDAAGERLWVDEDLPGATATQVREADLRAGRLPDFGSEGSVHTGGGRGPGSAGAAGASEHRIPEQLDPPRER